MERFQQLLDETFPVKCYKANCDGRCYCSVKLKGMHYPVCSSHNVLTRCRSKDGNHDFHLYWSFTLNPDVNPLLLAINSKKKYWFECPHNPCGCHVWYVRLNNFNLGTRCPFCSIPVKKICEHNSAWNNVPDIQEYWDWERNTVDPKTIASGTSEKFFFTCIHDPCGCHTWRCELSSFNAGTRCPYCVSQKICDHNSAWNNVPDIQEYWDQERNTVDPKTIAPNSEKECWFICPNDPCGCHFWQIRLIDFNRGGNKMPLLCKSKGL